MIKHFFYLYFQFFGVLFMNPDSGKKTSGPDTENTRIRNTDSTAGLRIRPFQPEPDFLNASRFNLAKSIEKLSTSGNDIYLIYNFFYFKEVPVPVKPVPVQFTVILFPAQEEIMRINTDNKNIFFICNRICLPISQLHRYSFSRRTIFFT